MAGRSQQCLQSWNGVEGLVHATHMLSPEPYSQPIGFLWWRGLVLSWSLKTLGFHLIFSTTWHFTSGLSERVLVTQSLPSHGKA